VQTNNLGLEFTRN